MKILKRLSFAIILLFCYSFSIFGQKNNLDSINISIDSTMKLNISILYNYKELGKTIEEDIKNLQTILKSEKNFPTNTPYLIIYEPDKRLSIKPSIDSKTIVWENGDTIQYQFKNECRFEAEDYNMEIHYDDIKSILSDSLLSTKIRQVVDSVHSIRSCRSYIYNYSLNGLDIIHNKKLDIRRPGSGDYLSFSVGIGANLIKNRAITDVLIEYTYTYRPKGFDEYQFFASTNAMMDFVDGIKAEGYLFIDIGVRNNYSKISYKPNWSGISIGYLVKKGGNLFEKNTFRFGFDWQIHKNITVTPQFYLSRNYYYPAIRIGFGL